MMPDPRSNEVPVPDKSSALKSVPTVHRAAGMTLGPRLAWGWEPRARTWKKQTDI